MKNQVYTRIDWLAGGICALISMAVYAWTAAPNVTLLDSGEFIVAAQHFGVPHPTGYPLWTILAWLFQLLPLGNAAWEIALLSGVLGALAVGICGLISHSSLRWLFPELSRNVTLPLSICFSLLFAFSVSMWSQATIAEVYTLHALLVGLYLASLYALIRFPQKDIHLFSCFFFLSLAFSNHHLCLALTPLPFIVVLLLRREIFADLIVFSLMTGVLFYLFFAILSEDMLTLGTALRFFYCALPAFIILLWVRRLRVKWSLLAFLPFVVTLGMLPYIYMPLASSTNPPMNWGYTRTAEGFFYSFNRSQYSGSLSDLFIKSLGRALGTASALPKEKAPELSLKKESRFDAARNWTGFFWLKLSESFTPISVVVFFASIFAVLRLDLPRRVWIYLLNFAFVLAAFLQPIMDKASIDYGGWWLQMPYHTYTNFLFAVLCTAGAAYLFGKIFIRRPRFSPVCWVLIFLPLLTLRANAPICSQRDRWFGWKYGHDILKNLPPGAVLYGGTDPGRFVPTYMIFGESSQPARYKRDPDFDRRDVYIITQNALGDKFYQRYIHDHYSENRPPVKNAFERWLGRDTHYPKKPLKLPNEEEFRKLVETAEKEYEKLPENQKIEIGSYVHARIAKWIFEQNRDEHTFFVEESFPMHWSYDYAVPHGIIYRLEKEPLKTLPPEVVEEDFRFWKNYIQELLSDPQYADDYDAQRSFSKLRTTMGNIYRHRGMKTEAEKAYEEAITLWPANLEAIIAASNLMWDREEFDRPIQLLENAYRHDVHNDVIVQLAGIAMKRKELQAEINAARRDVAANPNDPEPVTKLIRLYSTVEDTNRLTSTALEYGEKFATNASFQTMLRDIFLGRQDFKNAIPPVQRLMELEPTNPSHSYIQAKLQWRLGNLPEATNQFLNAMRIGGSSFQTEIRDDTDLQLMGRDMDIESLLKATPAASPVPETGSPQQP